MRYEFKYFETDLSGKETGNQMLTSFHADTLDQIMERFEYFLKGSGFHFDGKVDIVTDDINLQDDDAISINLGGGGASSEHSPYYYDYSRNKPFPWDNYSDLPATESYNIDLSDIDSPFSVNLDGDYEIKLDSSNVYFDYNNTMAGYPHER